MKFDPKAPANHPLHPKNAGQDAVLFALSDYLTAFERAAAADGGLPADEELRRRATLVAEYRQELADGDGTAEAPTLEDETGALHVWHELADDEDSGWQPIAEEQPEADVEEAAEEVAQEQPAEPATRRKSGRRRRGAASDLDDALAALDAEKGK